MTSAEKLFAIFETLCIQGEMSAAQLSRHLDINKGSVHRVLNTLRELGYVEDSSKVGQYLPTLKISGLGRQVEAKSSLAGLVRPFMKELLAKFNVVVNLGIFSGHHVHVVERLNPSGTPVSIVMDYTVPAYCSALGKLFLSRMSDAQVAQYLKQVQPVAYTEHTITTYEGLRAELAKVREQGYAVDDRELNLNLSCVAMPILDHSGNLLAALSLAGLPEASGPAFDQKLEDLRAAARSISKKMPM